MKRFLALTFVAIITVCMTACGGSGSPAEEPEEQGGGYADGTYTAEMFFEGDDGFTDTISLTVSGGKITEVEWNGISDGGEDRKTASKNGNYEIPDWHEQAEKMEAKVIETQDPYAIPLNDDGTTSEVPGVTTNVEFFLDLVDAALADATAGAEAGE